MFGMKTILKFLFIVFLIQTLAESRVYSQLVAMGHISAEVIESISASSIAVNSFDLAMNTKRDNNNQKQSGKSSERLNLGTITLRSGSNITCNVVLKSANLSDEAGNGFTLAPTLKNNSFASAALPNGEQKIQLEGRTNRTSNQAAGLYQGSYTVVFAYN